MQKTRIIFFATGIIQMLQGNIIPKNFGVSFEEGMQNNRLYTSTSALQYSAWNFVQKLYDSYVIDNLEYTESPCIPKIIHQIWVGPHPFPEKSKAFQQTWLKMHPNWEYKLWTNKDIEEFGLENKKLYDQASNYGQKSDIARYEILYRIGGLYIDTDFECLTPFDIFHHICDFYIGISHNVLHHFWLLNGLIGSAPGHPILKEAIDNLKNKTLNINHDKIQEQTGPLYLTNCFLKQALNGGRCIAFPVNYFYPWPNQERRHNKRSEILKWVRPETFAIHHWHTSWCVD